jgi:hypothetical protein
VATLDAAYALGNLPKGLRGELLTEYSKITRNYRERRWEAAELDGGRFSEIVYTILRGYIDGSYPKTASKPRNFPKSCEDLALASKANFPQSVRLGIPRVLLGLYEIRNNRGVGHVGGDVNANHMDATYVLHATQWVMAELVRLFHNTDVEVAARVVSALTDRTLPMIWEVGGTRRVLDIDAITDRTLARDLKQSRLANYRRVLKKLGEQLLIEYKEDTGEAFISPTGDKEVEERLLPEANLP